MQPKTYEEAYFRRHPDAPKTYEEAYFRRHPDAPRTYEEAYFRRNRLLLDDRIAETKNMLWRQAQNEMDKHQKELLPQVSPEDRDKLNILLTKIADFLLSPCVTAATMPPPLGPPPPQAPPRQQHHYRPQQQPSPSIGDTDDSMPQDRFSDDQAQQIEAFAAGVTPNMGEEPRR